MKKAELIERIIDMFTDMGSEDPEDTAMCSELTLADARRYLNEHRGIEKADLEPSEWLPAEVTPELYMEATNCYIRKCRHDVTVKRLAQFIEYGEMVDTYHEFDGKYHSDTDKVVYPTSWLTENMEFPFTPYDLDMLELIVLGQNSHDFYPDKKYCWYDEKTNELHSTNCPFEEGLIDAMAFAEWILESPGRVQYVQDWCMTNADIFNVFEYEVTKP